MDVATLVGRCRTGDALAWEMLVRRFQGRIYALAYYYVGNAEEARDLAQEVFVRIYTRLDACASDEAFVPWMIRLTRNMCIDRLRRMKARPQSIGTPVDEMTDLQAAGPNPAEQFQINSTKRLIHRALEKLGRISREMILLKEIQGLSLEEVSNLLGIPIGTAKSRSNRARIELAHQVRALTGNGAEDARN